MNDAKIDPAGRFWAGSCEMDFSEGLGGLWRLDEDWEAALVLANLTLPNGMGWSPDGGVFYLVETQARQILRFDFDLGTSTLTQAHPSSSTMTCSPTDSRMASPSIAAATSGSPRTRALPSTSSHQRAFAANRPVPTQTTSCNFVGPDWTNCGSRPRVADRPRQDRRSRLDLPRRRTRKPSALPYPPSEADVAITLTPRHSRQRSHPNAGRYRAGRRSRDGNPAARGIAHRTPAGGRSSRDGSMAGWLRGYPGGWQLLVPNAGPEREHDGARQGFHGEASIATWDLLAQERLVRAPDVPSHRAPAAPAAGVRRRRHADDRRRDREPLP